MADQTPSNATRRTVLRGAAWTAPVVMIAASAPLASASPEPPAATYLALGGSVTPKAGVNVTYQILGRAVEGGDEVPGEFAAGTSITITAPPGQTFTVVDPTAGVTGNGTNVVIITFPEATVGTVKGSFSGPGNATIVGSSPGLPSATLTATVSA